jgi:hypothetical protein
MIADSIRKDSKSKEAIIITTARNSDLHSRISSRIANIAAISKTAQHTIITIIAKTNATIIRVLTTATTTVIYHRVLTKDRQWVKALDKIRVGMMHRVQSIEIIEV